MKKITSIAFCVGLLFLFPAVFSAQKKANKKSPVAEKPAPSPTAEPTPAPTNDPSQGKRNVRPGAGTQSGKTAVGAPTYFYEYERPGFAYGRVLIEHDTNGKGKISFLKEGFSDMISDPIELTAVTLAKLNETFDALNFLDSNENYQHEKDFATLGNVTITLRRDGRERTVKYNYTDNKLAKALMDEYRRISNEYTWKFELTLAIENRPLEAPGLLNTMERYITSNEISDPQHMLPLLTQLSTDERIPLMARNRAAKLAKQLAKMSK